MPTCPPKSVFELEELAARNSKKTLQEYEKAKKTFQSNHPEGGNFDDQLSEQFRRVIAVLQQERRDFLSKGAQLKRRICRRWAINAAAFDSLFFDGNPTPSVRLLNELATLAKAADFDTALPCLTAALEERVFGDGSRRGATRKQQFTATDAKAATAAVRELRVVVGSFVSCCRCRVLILSTA